MRVLYVNHTAVISGAETSLLVLLRSLDPSVSPFVACPEGELAVAVRRTGIPVYPIRGTDLSARLHPRHTPREALKVVGAVRSIGSIARAVDADVIHANTPRAGLIAAFARGGGGAGPVTHVRDLMPPGRLPQTLFRLLAARASAFVATSRYVADQLPSIAISAIVANAVEPQRFDPAMIDRGVARARLGLDQAAPVLAVVGQIAPLKGQSDAIRALALVRRTHPDTRLLLVGSVKFLSAATRFDNRAYAEELVALARGLGVLDATIFLGERADVAEILAAVDVSLVPSWHEGFGRVALEAMMMQVPVVATAVGGTKEVITDTVDGLVLEPRDPETWARAICALLSDPARRAAMGARGRARALRDFSPERHADEMLAVYERVLDNPRRRAPATSVTP